ncbi:MAG TPA: diol dehydratase small subunit [Anaerolineae bacterium]|nr:diol dehydratase small subunit [Anaerolineae bacterium]HQI85806.1 diol dehydratase small subunit [Anaerolineae bacterium]
MRHKTICSATGRPLDTLNLEAVLAGQLTTEDFRISAETLRAQADAAEAAGYRQLAENFRRAAELTGISNEEVLAMYNTLRPGRTTYPQLLALSERLERDFNAPLTAALVREAAAVYLARGLVKEA